MQEVNKYSLILYISIILLNFLNSQTKVNNNIFDPKIFVNKQIPISRLQTAAHRFSVQSLDSNYEISGDVYESQTISEQNQIYNVSNYKKSESCTYFKSVLQMDSLQGQSLDYISLQSLVSEQTKQLFVIGMQDESENTNKFLKVYSFGSAHFQFQTQIKFDDTQFSSNIQDQIFMAKFENSTLFTDGNFLYQLQSTLNQKNNISSFSWMKVQGFISGINIWKAEEFLGIKKTVLNDKNVILFLYTQKVVFYEYLQNNKQVVLLLQIQNTGENAFEDIQIGQNSTQIYILSGNQLLFYTLQDLKTPVKHQLAGQLCTKIYIYHSTIHIICEYKKANYVAEYFYNDTMNVLVLNRFYNEIQNYRLLSYIKNYFLMVGQNDIILTSNGVNRKILLDMSKNAYSEKFVSFGIQNIHLLQKTSSLFNQILFAVGQDFVVLFKLKFVPAQVWCYIQRPPESLQKNILIVRNTSQCEMNQRKQTLKSICVNLKPVQIFFQHYEIQSKVTQIFVIIVILLVFVLAFLCLGCVFRQNMNYNQLLVNIRQKIRKLKTKPEELKQI